MNNPLEAVTQAVNSLVTALKLPDESAKANEVLGEMSFPQFSRLLPYRDYNQESGLFMNDTTMGFMLEAIPINGANESIVEALDHMLRTKRHCCKVSDEAAFCLIQRPYISKTLLTRRISPRGSP
ncbi:TraC family protein, partial [Klebsiella pneumoniae]|uniref:TraC family protein n=1 Tax=Klebsiella pneumoniae TaxID=573 RepID=UPI001D17E7E3